MIALSIKHLMRNCSTWLGAILFLTLSLTLSACSTTDQNTPVPQDSQKFAADWRKHSAPLFNHGPGISPGTTSWWVPAILPRGRYVLIHRVGDSAGLIDGYGFEIDGSPNKEIRLMLPSEYTGVEALEEKYVPDTKSAKTSH